MNARCGQASLLNVTLVGVAMKGRAFFEKALV